MPSTYTGWQSDRDFDCNMRYKRIDDLIFTFEVSEGTSNPLDEDENEDAAEEEDADADKGATNVVRESESNLDPIR